MNMEYGVGQVVYLLNHNSLTIVPALVVEEIIRITVDEKTKQYVVELPGETNKRAILQDVKARVFKDIEALRNHMLENTRVSVEKLINNAIDKKDLFFGENAIDLQSANKAKEVKEKILDNKAANQKQAKHVQKNIKEVIMNSENNTNNDKTKEEK